MSEVFESSKQASDSDRFEDATTEADPSGQCDGSFWRAWITSIERHLKVESFVDIFTTLVANRAAAGQICCTSPGYHAASQLLTLRGRIHTLEDSHSPLLNLRCLQLQGDHPNKWSGDDLMIDRLFDPHKSVQRSLLLDTEWMPIDHALETHAEIEGQVTLILCFLCPVQKFDWAG